MIDIPVRREIGAVDRDGLAVLRLNPNLTPVIEHVLAHEEPEPTRVVLVKPGDTLLIGNVGAWEDEVLDAAVDALGELGFARVLIFAGDITMGACSEKDGGFDAGYMEARPVQLAHDAEAEGVEDEDRPRHQGQG